MATIERVHRHVTNPNTIRTVIGKRLKTEVAVVIANETVVVVQRIVHRVTVNVHRNMIDILVAEAAAEVVAVDIGHRQVSIGIDLVIVNANTPTRVCLCIFFN